ncbi:MAG: hypothetical protein FWG14_12290 [Peptococcaceae bacterium]|nr:hypothetical protein [Peptococcaceae bacterium]
MSTLFKLNDCFGNLDVPSNYKWDMKIDDKYFIGDVEDDRLFEALSKSGQKAAMACALMVFEGIVLRVAKDTDLLDMPQWLEALWAGTLNPVYIKNWDCDYDKFSMTADQEIGPLAASISILSYAMKHYTKRTYYLHNKFVKLFMLFRHITPNRKTFDNWLSATLKKMVDISPCPYSYDDLDGNTKAIYDSAEEITLPRGFFINPDYVYTESLEKEELRQFLKSLDYRNNPYLSSPDEMLSNGFVGEPYNL